MELTAKQQQGLDITIQRYLDKERYTVISGYAGSGKSTLIQFIVSALAQYGVDPDEDVCFCAYTGKATQVLAQKGATNVCTLHKLLYDSFPRPDGTFMRKPKVVLDYHVIIVDEISMAPKTLIDLLLTHHCYVIGLGDPFQLPPIDKKDDNGLLNHPHIFLDEIMRQAAESEIIQLTMKIRAGDNIDYFKGKEVQVIQKEELNTGMLTWADQILCATNRVRNNVNRQTRKLLHPEVNSNEPCFNEKVICLRNYWECCSDQGNALINGTIGYLKNPFEQAFRIPKWVYNCPPTVQITTSEFITDTNEHFDALDMDTKMIIEGDPCLDNYQKYRLSKNPKTQHLVPMEFTLGYCVTGHKAQGSEWEKVLVLEESFPFAREEHARWLYTCCTRASSKLVLLR